MSYSSVQIQSEARNAAFIPYSGCDPVQKLSDITGEEDVFLPIDFYATNANWKGQYNLTEVMNMTLRPCGGLYYWIPTDSISLKAPSGAVLSLSGITWDTLSIPSEPLGRSFPYTDPITNEFVWADPSTDQMRAWARSNIHSTFMVKAGTIKGPLKSGIYTVGVTKCRDLQSDKFIKLCTTNWIGYNQYFLSAIYFTVAAVLFASLVAYFTIKPSRERRQITLFN